MAVKANLETSAQEVLSTKSQTGSYRLLPNIKEDIDKRRPSRICESLKILDNAKMNYHKVEESNNELTMRSVFVGTCIGILMAAQNVYFGLRNGMSFGEGMVASILGYGLAKTILRRFFSGFHLHEHVIMQTAASANISIIFSGGFTQYILAMTPDVQQANRLGKPEDTWVPTYSLSLLWLATAAYLGFFVSQPYRKKLIVEQRLPWPHPTATAKVLRILHQNNDESRLLTSRLSSSIAVAFSWHWLKWIFNYAGQMDRWPILGFAAARYSWYTDWSPAYIAGGMLTTPNAVFSMVLGGLFGYGFILPYVSTKRGIWFAEDGVGMEGPKAYWFLSSLTIVVVDGIYHALRLIILSMLDYVKSNKNKGLMLQNTYEEEEPPSRLIPAKFWIAAFIINLIAVVVILPFFFPVKWYMVLSIVLIAIPLGYSVCLGGAITGTFIISAVGKLVLIIVGPLTGSVLGSLWLSGVGMITVGSTEQILVDYQVAHLTKTSPRQMFKAQIFAATVGFLLTPICYMLFIQAFNITSDGQYTAPGGVALRSLAVLFSDGVGILPSNISYFIILSASLAITNCALHDILPSCYSAYLPNTMAFAIGFYVNGSYPINTLIGGVVRYIWRRTNPESEKKLCCVIAAGMIVGEGLAAITQAVAVVSGIHPPSSLAIRFGN